MKTVSIVKLWILSVPMVFWIGYAVAVGERTSPVRCEKCGYSGEDAPTNAWPDAEISRDRFRAMLDNEAARRAHAFRSNQHYYLHGGAVKP